MNAMREKATKPFTIYVTPTVFGRLEKMAGTAKCSTAAYASMLFFAAYSARCQETGDHDLDTAVSRVALLFGTRFDTASIAETVGLSEGFVERVVAGWRSELLGASCDQAGVA